MVNENVRIIKNNEEGCPFCRGQFGSLTNRDKSLEVTLELEFKSEVPTVSFVATGKDGKGRETEVKLPIAFCPKCGKKFR